EILASTSKAHASCFAFPRSLYRVGTNAVEEIARPSPPESTVLREKPFANNQHLASPRQGNIEEALLLLELLIFLFLLHLENQRMWQRPPMQAIRSTREQAPLI